MRGVFLDPGRLRSELSLQAAERASDGQGGFVETWSEVAGVFALVEPLAARDVFEADRPAAEVTHRITIRARAGVGAGMRFVRDTRVFAILAMHDPDESGRFLVCRAREDTA